MRLLERLGALATSHGGKKCLIVAGPGPAWKVAQQSLDAAGLTTEVHHTLDGPRWPTPDYVKAAVRAAGRCTAEIVVGVGTGGVLDLAKSVSTIHGLSIQRQKGGPRHLGTGMPLEPAKSLPLWLVPTTASVAIASGRALLWDEEIGNYLIPMPVAEPAPFVGPSDASPELEPKEIITDVKLMSKQSVRGVAAAAGHALSIMVDSIAASTNIGPHSFSGEMASNVMPMRKALTKPKAAHAEALQAVFTAGTAISAADADTQGGLPLIHTLSCVAAVAWSDIPFSAVATLLLPPVLRMWNIHAESDVKTRLTLLTEAVLQQPGVGILDLATWIEECCGKARVIGPQLQEWESPDRAAAVLALRASESHVFQLGPAPGWLSDSSCMAEIFRMALESNRCT